MIKILLISFLNFILSLPFTIFGFSKFNVNETRANWQPPGYVFGIVWPILYLIFGIINLIIFNSNSLNIDIKNILIRDSIFEALIQTLWLLVTSNFGNGRNLIQYLLGFIIIGYLVYFSFYRRTSFINNNKLLLYLYIPYSLWIIFAFILNLQLVIKKWKKI